MDIQDLWKMSSHEFNKWRRENDLKHLFEHFKSVLPEFEKWLKAGAADQIDHLNPEQIDHHFHCQRFQVHADEACG